MAIKFYELCGENSALCFSPFAWRTKMMLLHKGIKFEAIPCAFTDKEPYAESGSKTVPVINDKGRWVSDSFNIAEYLDEAYPNNPLFTNDTSRQQARLLNDWINQNILMKIFRITAVEVWQHLAPKDQEYFRTTREKYVDTSLEALASDPEKQLEDIRKSLHTVSKLLDHHDWLSGAQPGWLDYMVFGTLMWPHIIAPFAIIDSGHPMHAWWLDMMALFDGYGANVTKVKSEIE